MKKRIRSKEDEEQECGREGSGINDLDSRTRKMRIWSHKDKARIDKDKNQEPPRKKMVIMNSGATKAMMMSLTLFLRLLVTPLAKTNRTVGGENMISF